MQLLYCFAFDIHLTLSRADDKLCLNDGGKDDQILSVVV